MNTMKSQGPFFRVGNDDCDAYEAKFRLADDGTPGGEQHLIVRVEVRDDRQEISLFKESWGKRKAICECEVNAVDRIADLLYGAAQLKTIRMIAPITIQRIQAT